MPVPPGWEEDEFRRLELYDQQVLHIAVQALRDAGLWEQRDSPRVGLVFLKTKVSPRAKRLVFRGHPWYFYG